MKKLLFAFPMVALLAAGCSSSQQAANTTPVQTQVAQSTTVTPTPSPTPTTLSTPTPSQNSGDQYLQFNNSAFGINFKYPNTWVNFPLMPNNGRDIVTLVPNNATANDISNSIGLGYLANSKKENLSDYFLGYQKIVGGTWTKFSEGEVQGYKAVFTTPNSVTVYYFERPNTQEPIFTFNIAGTAVPITDALISSIHFTAPDGSALPQGADYGVMFGH